MKPIWILFALCVINFVGSASPSFGSEAQELTRITGDRKGVVLSRGDKAGNGGDVVDCRRTVWVPDNGQMDGHWETAGTIELLDFYEGRVIRKIERDLGTDTLSVEEKLELAIERIEKLDPGRALLYRKWISEFWNEALFLDGINLIDVNDSDHVALPQNCQVTQIAIQKKPEFPEDPYYIINQDLWQALDNDGKAGLVLHEIAYREAIAEGHENSVNTRYLVQHLTSNKVPEMTIKKWSEIRNAADFPYSYADRIGEKDRAFFFVKGNQTIVGDICKHHEMSAADFSGLEMAYPGIGNHLVATGLLGTSADSSFALLSQKLTDTTPIYYVWRMYHNRIDANPSGSVFSPLSLPIACVIEF